MRKNKRLRWNMIITMIGQSIVDRRFFLSGIAIAAMQMLSLIGEFAELSRMIASMKAYGEISLSAGYHMQLWDEGTKSSAFLVSLTLLCTLIQSSSCIDERKCGFLKSLLPRTGYRTYIIGKLLSAIVAGGLAAIFGTALSYLFLCAFIGRFESGIEMGQTISILFSNSFRIFCLGALWSVMGMTAALIFSSRYLAWSFPFLFYYMLEIFVRRFAPQLTILAPGTWGITNTSYIPILVLLTSISTLYIWKIKKNLRRKKAKTCTNPYERPSP